MPKAQVLIVGGGFAGLCCALKLHENGVPFKIFEASDDVGGRARTDIKDGFLLDRGFQVLLTAYPEAQKIFDYDALNLAKFNPGALVRYKGRFHRFVDPWRSPKHLLETALSPIASLADKLRVARLRRRVCKGSLDQLFSLPERSTAQALCEGGFSNRIIEHFFRPFLGGVFLDSQLQTSSRMFDFVFRMFSEGDAVLPANGMGALSRQIADQFPQKAIKTNSRISHVEKNMIELSTGEKVYGDVIVVACDAPSASTLLDGNIDPSGQSVTCIYYAADKPPIEEPILVLNGEGKGPINNLCVPSQISRSYAPSNRTLVSVSVIGMPKDETVLEMEVNEQLHDWFGAAVCEWQHLRTYQIPYALPRKPELGLSTVANKIDHNRGIYGCGDYLETASIQGAMFSGRHVAEKILNAL